jgi:hypothetical protein
MFAVSRPTYCNGLEGIDLPGQGKDRHGWCKPKILRARETNLFFLIFPPPVTFEYAECAKQHQFTKVLHSQRFPVLNTIAEIQEGVFSLFSCNRRVRLLQDALYDFNRASQIFFELFIFNLALKILKTCEKLGLDCYESRMLTLSSSGYFVRRTIGFNKNPFRMVGLASICPINADLLAATILSHSF